ncbi:cleavage and polyadenylation specificity factor subunit 1 (CFT1) [Vairimorpha necatrix]|uniref:Cleavage and polyadenylation specificity factor subunit 1 (CFT1) n=1 Tax=Vairimorpha necatrix TaxID=6039 RepID=A0AAX4J8J2_9MICR
MNIQYSKKNMINCFEGCAVGNFYNNKKGLVFFNKNILKFYKFDEEGKMTFLHDKLLFENVLQIETYKINSELDGLLICYESTKISTLHFVDDFPVINSLKCFERDQYDIRLEDHKFLRMGKDIAILKLSRRFFSIFSLNKEHFPAQVFSFMDVNEKIKNVIDLVFLSNYIVPTFCIVYDPTPVSYIKSSEKQAIICSFDSKLNTFYVIDEFTVPTYTNRVIYSNNLLLFISENEIFLKTTGSCLYYPLNKMSLYCKNNLERDVVIKDSQIYLENEYLLIFNGDGKIYSFFIEIDSGRIIDLVIRETEHFVIPKYIYRNKDYFFVGSNEDSYLFKIFYSSNSLLNKQVDDIKKVKQNITELETTINEEYERLYGTTMDSLEKKIIQLEKIYRFPGIGYINDLCIKNDKEFICCSEGSKNHIIEVSNFLKVDVKKICECINFEKIFLYDKKIFIKKENLIQSIYEEENIYFPEELKSALVSFQYNQLNYIITHNKIVTYEGNNKINQEELEFDLNSCSFIELDSFLFLGLLNKKNNFELRNLNNQTKVNFEKVNSFCFYEEFCIININNNIIFYDLKTSQNKWFIPDITNLDYTYKIDNVDDNVERDFYYKIVEMKIIKIQEMPVLLLINDRGHFAIFKIVETQFIKILVEEPITFRKQKSDQYFTKIGDFIYINSKFPYFLYVNDRLEFFFYRSKYNIRDVLLDGENCYFLIHDKFVKANLPKIKKSKLSVKSNLLRNLCVQDEEIYDRFVFKKISVEMTPKNIEISGNYILIVSSTKVKYQEDDSSLDVFTQKYSISLYTNYYKLISTFELENDEYVFDIIELSLNDVIGVNGKSNFIVVCVTKIEGEDKHSRGRLIVLELIDIVVDETNKYKDKKLKLIASENIKGCITKCDVVKGNVIVALGIKSMVYKIDRSEGLIPIGIHDLNTLTTSMITIKNFVVFSDIYRGLSFFYFQKRPVRLNLLCNSDPINYATHVDFIVKGSSLGIVCMDIYGNMHVFTYSPLNILSCDGTKFVKRCETKFNLGRLIMKRSHSKLTNPIFISDSNYIIELDSFSEENYQCFLKCQNYYLTTLEDTYGLNEENFNGFDFHLKPPSLKRPILKEAIMRFLHLPVDKKNNLHKDESKIYENIE